MKKVAIITGVTSFLGKSTAKYLLSKGFIVFGIVRPDSTRKENIKNIRGLNIIEIDFDTLTKDDFDEFINAHSDKEFKDIKKADITFIHFAWGATLDRSNFMMQMLNVDYSMKVLKFAKIMKVRRFIFAGSQAEYSDTAYGMAKKKFADEAVKSLKDTDINFIHFRIFSIYGKDDRENSLIKELARCLRSNTNIDLSSCNYKWNFLFIDDFVSIVYGFIENDAHADTYDIASDDTRLLKEYCISAKEALKSKAKLRFGARLDSIETFAIPNIRKLKSIMPDITFTKFEKGIKTI